MLVLSRKLGEKVCIGTGITITVLEAQGRRVRIGIEAPDHITILRGELTAEPPSTATPSIETDRSRLKPR